MMGVKKREEGRGIGLGSGIRKRRMDWIGLDGICIYVYLSRHVMTGMVFGLRYGTSACMAFWYGMVQGYDMLCDGYAMAMRWLCYDMLGIGSTEMWIWRDASGVQSSPVQSALPYTKE